MRNCISCGGGVASPEYDCRHWDWYMKRWPRGLESGSACPATMCWYPEGCLHIAFEEEEV